MKKLLLLTIGSIFLFFSCMTYEYISVKPSNKIPDGTQSVIIPNATLDVVKELFKDNQIMYKTFETGIESEIILLDDRTKAQYKVHEFDNTLKLTCYRGYTDKVKSEMTLWVGYVEASKYDTQSMNLIVYDKNILKQKKVFDYLIQMLETKGIKYELKK